MNPSAPRDLRGCCTRKIVHWMWDNWRCVSLNTRDERVLFACFFFVKKKKRSSVAVPPKVEQRNPETERQKRIIQERRRRSKGSDRIIKEEKERRKGISRSRLVCVSVNRARVSRVLREILWAKQSVWCLRALKTNPEFGFLFGPSVFLSFPCHPDGSSARSLSPAAGCWRANSIDLPSPPPSSSVGCCYIAAALYRWPTVALHLLSLRICELRRLLCHQRSESGSGSLMFTLRTR